MVTDSTRVRLPKEILMAEILDRVSPAIIHEEFGGQLRTPLKSILGRQTKSQLAEFLFRVSPRAKSDVRELEHKYPLRAAPTLYILKLVQAPSATELIQITTELSKGGQKEAEDFTERERVWRVFVDEQASLVELVLEIPLGYLRRIEYRQANPTSDKYRQIEVIDSFEQALLWIPPGSAFAILGCCDYPALKPIRIFLQKRLDIVVVNPIFTPEMMRRVAAKSSPLSASFSAHSFSATGTIDVKTVTLADPDLQTRAIFKYALQDPQRPQIAGYYTGGDLVEDSGFAVSRKRSSVWTPSQQDREELVRIGVAVLQRIQKEVKHIEQDRLWKELVNMHGSAPVTLGHSELTGEPRTLLGTLLAKVLESMQRKQAVPMTELEIGALVRNQTRLRLESRVESTCETCQLPNLVICLSCGESVKLGWNEEKQILQARCTLKCKFDGKTTIRMQCPCGAEPEDVEVRTSSVVLTPAPELLKAISDLSQTVGRGFRGIFRIAQGSLLAAESAKQPNFMKVSLYDLERWRKVNLTTTFDETRRKQLLNYVAATKEKCYREIRGLKGEVLFKDKTPPSHEKCRACMRQTLPVELLRKGQLCLARVFGIPIGEKLDGVHHGWEVADVRYQDSDRPGGQKELVAIHLKSHTKDWPKGLGRSNRAVKELYTQLFHLAFRMNAHQPDARDIGVLGVSIPNLLAEDVRMSFHELGAQLGIKVIVLEEEHWLSVFHAAEEALIATAAKPRGRES